MLMPTAADDDHGPGPGHGHLQSHRPTRRSLLRTTSAAALGGLLLPAWAQPAELPPTSEDALGPFYPLSLPAEHDFDLTALAGRAGRAEGRLLHVGGRVLDRRGEPLVDAAVEIWQANAAGRYDHPRDTSPAPLDPNFQGFARVRTDAEGRYRFKTIQPGEYGSRTPHIHFDVRARGSRLVTQMYFEGEPRNESDGLLRRRSPESRRTTMAREVAPAAGQERTARAVQWDIVLNLG